MKRNLFPRLAALLLCLCLLPVSALAYGDMPIFRDQPVYTSDMEVRFALNADAFPDDGAADYKGWQEFLSKLSFKGHLDAQQPFTRDVRGYFNGGLYLKEELTIPFEVDVYFNYRYLKSRALRDENLYFQMDNFLEFMMKPRYFMDLPTELIALGMYPEATVDMIGRFYTPLEQLTAGSGSRSVSYDDLYDLCLSWEDMYYNDPDDINKLYYYLTCLLYDLGVNYDVYDAIGMMTDYLDFLDPEQKGMTITEADGVEAYVIGDTTVFSRQMEQDGNFMLVLPNEEGAILSVRSEKQAGGWEGDDLELTLSIDIPNEDSETGMENWLCLNLDMEDVPLHSIYHTTSTIIYSASGTALEEPVAPVRFEMFIYHSALELPRTTWVDLHYIHPETNQRAFTVSFTGWMQEFDYTILAERTYTTEDFFHLNDEVLSRYKERYIPSMALSFLPVLAEMPAGVINDIIRFAEANDILVSLGVE